VIYVIFESCETTRCLSAIAFSPDGTRLAAGMYSARDAHVRGKNYAADVSRTVEIFPLDVTGPGIIVAQTMQRGNQGPLDQRTPAIQFLDHGRQLAILLNEKRWNRENRLDVWDVDARHQVRSDSSESDVVQGFVYSPDETVVALHTGFNIFIRSLSTGADLHQNDDARALFWETPQLVFSPDGRYFATKVSSGKVKIAIWETDKWAIHHELTTGESSLITSIAFSDDSRLLAASGDSIRVLNIETGDANELPHDPENYIRQIAFLPGGQTLIASSALGVELIDLETARSSLRIPAPQRSTMLCMAVSPDGKLVATGDDNGRVTLWNIATGAKIRELAIGGDYKIRWPVPVSLLALWIIAYPIVANRRFLAWARSARG
jgi:WD40 repeat protein